MEDAGDARGWLDAVEAALVAEALGRAPSAAAQAADALDDDRRAAALAAVAAKFLAVGTPRTLAVIGAGALAPIIVAAQRAYAAPRELRVFDGDPVAAARVAEAIGGRVVSLAEACAADIVVARGPVAIRREWLRGGTHVTALDRGVVLDPAARAAAMIYTRRELARVAAGFVDGRQLDEITVAFLDQGTQ